MAIKNVILVGAGGNLGPQILKTLLDAQYNVTVVSRASSKAQIPSGVKVVQVGDDYPHNELVGIFTGQDAVVSTISSSVITSQKHLVDAATEAGVKRFIPSEWGAPAKPGMENQFPHAGKAEMRAYLATKESQGLTWTGICNNNFMEWTIEKNVMQVDLQKRKAARLDDGNNLFPMSTWQTVGAALLGVFEHLEETKNRLVYVATVHITQNQLIEAAERVVGEKFEVSTFDSKTWVPDQGAKAAKGDFGGIMNSLWALSTEQTDWRSHLDNKLLGVPEESLDSVIQRVANGVLAK